MKAEPVDRLWDMTHQQWVDPDLLRAVLSELPTENLDERTRLLVTACGHALKGETSKEFPSLRKRLVAVTKKDTLEQYFRELGTEIRQPVDLYVGGSSALILHDLLNRNTEDIDVVDELPAPLRELHSWRKRAQDRYGVYLAHFQSRYLPGGWRERLSFHGHYGPLRVYLVDPIDLFVGKLFSKRLKDLDDLRALVSRLPREAIDRRFQEAAGLRADPDRLRQAAKNHYIVFGD